MHHAMRTLRGLAFALVAGLAFGVVATGAGVVYAIWRSDGAPSNGQMLILNGDDGGHGITTVSVSEYATSVQVQLFGPGNPQASITSIRFEPTPREYRGLGGDTYESPALADGWSRGLSVPMKTDQPAWKETVYGWPYLCFRVRGQTLNDGPLKQIPSTWAGVAGWGVAWGETGQSLAAFGLPACAAAVLVGPVRRALRRRNGQCAACGYDLRGVPAGCPECGLSEPEAQARTRRVGSPDERPA